MKSIRIYLLLIVVVIYVQSCVNDSNTFMHSNNRRKFYDALSDDVDSIKYSFLWEVDTFKFCFYPRLDSGDLDENLHYLEIPIDSAHINKKYKIKFERNTFYSSNRTRMKKSEDAFIKILRNKELDIMIALYDVSASGNSGYSLYSLYKLNEDSIQLERVGMGLSEGKAMVKYMKMRNDTFEVLSPKDDKK